MFMQVMLPKVIQHSLSVTITSQSLLIGGWNINQLLDKFTLPLKDVVTNTSSFLRAVLSILLGEQKPATSGAWTCNLWLQAQLFNHQATNAWYDYCSQITIKHHKYYTNTLNTIRSKGLTCTHYWDQNKLYSEVFIRYDSISYLVHVTSDTKEWLLLSVLSILFDWIITLNGFIKSLSAVGKTDVTILYFVIPKIMADKLFLRVLGNSNEELW